MAVFGHNERKGVKLSHAISAFLIIVVLMRF